MIDFKFLREMGAMIDGIPDDRFNLKTFGRPDPNVCDTIGCAFGWIAAHPDAGKRGVEIGAHETFYLHGQVDGVVECGKHLFGIDYVQFWNLFTERGESKLDDANFVSPTISHPDDADVYDIDYDNAPSDKDVFRARLVAFLTEHGQTSAQCIARGETP